MLNESQKTSQNQTLGNEIVAAYMTLYNTLVKAYLSRGMPNGRSWYNATLAMRSIITKRRGEIPGFVFSQLAKTFNTHKQTVSKKSMVSQDKDVKQMQTQPNLRDAIQEFDDTLKNATNKYYSALMNTVPAITQMGYSK